MKQFAAWFTHGIPNGSTLRKAIFEAKSGPTVLAAVEAFFASRACQPADPNHAPMDESMSLEALAAGCD
jgi:hypothetical protein